jgi:hypothetical protein
MWNGFGHPHLMLTCYYCRSAEISTGGVISISICLFDWNSVRARVRVRVCVCECMCVCLCV